MTITFENDSDVIVYALEKIISFARENQYLFVANCAWWISGVINLQQRLINHIDNLEARKAVIHNRAISVTPRDIARGVSPEGKFSDYIPDPLRRTRKGRINPTPQSKRQLRKARKALQRIEREKLSTQEAKLNQRHREIRATIIRNNSKE
jgi:hypothetical protein